MASSPADKAQAKAARALLAGAVRAHRSRIFLPVLLGLGRIGCGLVFAWMLARILASLLGAGQAGWGLLAAAGSFAILGAALGVAQEGAQHAAGAAARAALRRRVFGRLLETGMDDDRPVGTRLALAVDQVEAMDGYFARWMPAAILAVLGPLGIALIIGFMDPLSGAILAVAWVMVPVAMAVTGIGAAQASRRQFEALGRLSGRFLDRVRGLPMLVLFRREEAEAASLGKAASELRQRTMRVLRVAFLSTGAMEAIAAAVLACLAWRHGASLLHGGHPMPVAAIFIILAVPAFFAPLRAFSAAYHEQLSAKGAAVELAPLLAGEPEKGLLLEEMPPKLVVTFQDVSLRYDPARPLALEGVNFRVMPGETLLMTGPSGAGKSSVLRLLMGFRRPDAGRVSFNGRDAMSLAPAELRRLSAYVGQKAHLFRASLRENIRFARPEASDAEVEAAAKAARVTNFAQDLPKGLDTLLGEGGWGISGGQAQRVAVARAFLRDAPLVLLDEPTAHLDPQTEMELTESLRRLCVGRTAIIATHSRHLTQSFLRQGAKQIEIEAGRVNATARMAGN
ncbi:thiol reductant ABC exporter subunit CydD [Acetobacteraceae bacterium H6797]|nr:thiol reductant ABC exporter subunit CydD [Acetobacteraceae bacterium H6797]